MNNSFNTYKNKFICWKMMRIARNSYLQISQLFLKLRSNIQYNELKECMG